MNTAALVAGAGGGGSGDSEVMAPSLTLLTRTPVRQRSAGDRRSVGGSFGVHTGGAVSSAAPHQNR